MNRLTVVKFSDKGLRTGAAGMPMVDAMMTSFVFSEELSFRDCRSIRKRLCKYLKLHKVKSNQPTRDFF